MEKRYEKLWGQLAPNPERVMRLWEEWWSPRQGGDGDQD